MSTASKKKLSVFIATFAMFEDGIRLKTNGMIEPLMSFFLPRSSRLMLLVQPHPGSNITNPLVEEYKGLHLKNKYKISPILYFPIYILCRLNNSDAPHFVFKLRDFFSVLLLGYFKKDKYDLFIGLEAVNAMAGVILRKIGKVKHVVYYVSDYSPERFENKTLNFFYLLMDRLCVKYADYTWDVSPAMIEARIKAGLSEEFRKKAVHVPNGLFPSQIDSFPLSKRDKNSLIYMGTLSYDMGPDMAILSLKKIIKKKPAIKLSIVGGAEADIRRLKNLSKKLGILNSVIFYGFIEDNSKMAEVVRSSYIGLAPYRNIHGSIRLYGDAGKIRQYLASGLPVVTTNVPPLGREVAGKGAALMVNDSVEAFSNAIIKLLEDEKLYLKLSKKAQEISKNNTWEESYAKAVKDMDVN